MISIICVYNNKTVLDNVLLESLKFQSIKYELILIDNRKNEFTSIAAALNYGSKKTSGKYLMFVHQDVNLLTKNWLEIAEKTLDKLNNIGIAGVAGISDILPDNLRMRNVIINDDKLWGNKILTPEKAQTLDECLFIIPRETFKKFQFDERVCNSWHLYAVDYSLYARKMGFNVYVIPLKIHHKCSAFKTFVEKRDDKSNLFHHLEAMPASYYRSLGKLIKKYKNDIGMIYTSCGNYHVDNFLFLRRFTAILYEFFKRINKKIF